MGTVVLGPDGSAQSDRRGPGGGGGKRHPGPARSPRALEVTPRGGVVGAAGEETPAARQVGGGAGTPGDWAHSSPTCHSNCRTRRSPASFGKGASVLPRGPFQHLRAPPPPTPDERRPPPPPPLTHTFYSCAFHSFPSRLAPCLATIGAVSPSVHPCIRPLLWMPPTVHRTPQSPSRPILDTLVRQGFAL